MYLLSLITEIRDMRYCFLVDSDRPFGLKPFSVLATTISDSTHRTSSQRQAFAKYNVSFQVSQYTLKMLIKSKVKLCYSRLTYTQLNNNNSFRYLTFRTIFHCTSAKNLFLCIRDCWLHIRLYWLPRLPVTYQDIDCLVARNIL